MDQLLFNAPRAPSKYDTLNMDKYRFDNHKKNNHNKNESDLLFELPLSQYLERSGFTYIKDDSHDRYIADIVAHGALNDDEYWDGHNMANTIPWIDGGDDLDNLINGFDHGTIASKK